MEQQSQESFHRKIQTATQYKKQTNIINQEQWPLKKKGETEWRKAERQLFISCSDRGRGSERDKMLDSGAF